MPEYKCGNCREVLSLSHRAKFCPECGSSSLNLVIKEAVAEPSSKETVGVYTPQMLEHDVKDAISKIEDSLVSGSHYSEIVDTEPKQEEDQPRKKRR